MPSPNSGKFYSLRADANALGGLIGGLHQRAIPTLAPVSLPAVGGSATARSDGLNLDELISCGSAYTRVTGSELTDGSLSIMVMSTLENLNILELVTARRIVSQVAIFISGKTGELRFSLAGSQFEGLRIAGRECQPKLNETLTRPHGNGEHCELPLTRDNVRQIGQEQATRVVSAFQGRTGTFEWANARHGWMTDDKRAPSGLILCSLVDGFRFGDDRSEENSGHVADIPGFGRIILGEACISRSSVYLVAVRAELDCHRIQIRAVAGSGGGSGEGNKD